MAVEFYVRSITVADAIMSAVVADAFDNGLNMIHFWNIFMGKKKRQQSYFVIHIRILWNLNIYPIQLNLKLKLQRPQKNDMIYQKDGEVRRSSFEWTSQASF